MQRHKHTATVTVCTNAEHIREHVSDLACQLLTPEQCDFFNDTDGLSGRDIDSLVEIYVNDMGSAIWSAGNDAGIEIIDKSDKHFQNWSGGKYRGFYYDVSATTEMARKLAADAIEAAAASMARTLSCFALRMIENARASRIEEPD
jgi:hypothetical protein